jgi:hypothetical protein
VISKLHGEYCCNSLSEPIGTRISICTEFLQNVVSRRGAFWNEKEETPSTLPSAAHRETGCVSFQQRIELGTGFNGYYGVRAFLCDGNGCITNICAHVHNPACRQGPTKHRKKAIIKSVFNAIFGNLLSGTKLDAERVSYGGWRFGAKPPQHSKEDRRHKVKNERSHDKPGG